MKRWAGWAVYQLPWQENAEEMLVDRYFTRWGAQFALDMKLGAPALLVLYCRGDIEWIRGEIRPA